MSDRCGRTAKMTDAGIIGIRVDMNEHIATGQFMRCAAVAGRLAERGYRTVFISADEGILPFAGERGLETEILHTDWRDTESETVGLVAYLGRRGIKRLLVDSYQETERSLREIRENGIRTAYFDDLDAMVYPADILINYSSYPDRRYYQKKYEGTDTRLLIGPEYVPLRPQFADVQRSEDTHAGRKPVLFLTTGGSDPIGIAALVLRELRMNRMWQECEVRLLSGCYCSVPEEIENDARVTIYRGISDVAGLMAGCDLAATPAGTTMYELCACGVPSVSYIFADNMRSDAVFWGNNGMIPYAGDFREDPEKCAARTVRLLTELWDERTSGKGADRVRALQSAFDGHGTQRIADELIRL